MNRGQISKERERLMEELRAINKREGEERAAIEVPKLKRKYENKCFVFNDNDGENRWKIYTLVLGVLSEHSFRTFQFDTRPVIRGEIIEYIVPLGKEVKKSEFDKAYRTAIKTLWKISENENEKIK